MLYGDIDIASRLALDPAERADLSKIIIDPLPVGMQLQPASIDLRLGDKFKVMLPARVDTTAEPAFYRGPGFVRLRPPALERHGYADAFSAEQAQHALVGHRWGMDGVQYAEFSLDEDRPCLELPPGSFVLAHTVERIRIPRDLAGRVEGRSSLGRLALLVHATAGFLDPGFDGQITLEIAVIGNQGVRLLRGQRISQVVFHALQTPSDMPYGDPRRPSKYQNQRGPQRSRFESERIALPPPPKPADHVVGVTPATSTPQDNNP